MKLPAIAPCPFCKLDEAKLHSTLLEKSVFCPACESEGPTESTDKGAIEAWNRAASAPEKYDDTLIPFLAMMRNELHANAGKGDRPGWLQMSPNECLLEIYYHVSKLQKAIRHADVALIGEHSADVANMAMMMADIVGLLPQEIAEEVPA